MYIPEDCEGASGCESMKVAMWFDMLGMIFWFSSAVGKYLPLLLPLRHTSPYDILTSTSRWRVHVLEGTA